MRVTRIEKKKLYAGVLLILLGIVSPVLANVENFGIMAVAERGLLNFEKVDVIEAALRLVLLNAVRSFPHYVGAFLWPTLLKWKSKGKKQGG